MIAEDEDALICDLAETYHIYDYEALPCELVATLAAGLRPNSRIVMKLTGQKLPQNELALLYVLDNVRLLVWQHSSDGAKNRRKPKSIVEEVMEKDKKQQFAVFDTPDDFETARAEAVKRFMEKKNG